MSKTCCTFCLSFFILFIVLSSSLSAQTTISSPYSRYGIGDLTPISNAWNLSMGESGIALRSPTHINLVNPASFTAFDSTSFIFEGGVIINSVQLRSTLQYASRTYASVGYLTFGFPVTKWWKTSLGLLPFSNVGYNVIADTTMPGIGHSARIYSGSGGINSFYWGNAFRLFKNLSIGFKASYLFGTITREASSTYPDSLYYLNLRETNNITLSGIYLDYGIQYTARLKNDLVMTVGGIFGTNSIIHGKTDYLALTYFESSGTEYPKDTIANEAGVRGSVTIPMMFGAGIAFEKTDKWLASIDYKWQNWKNYRSFDQNDSLINSYKISAGVELIPDANNYTNYLKRLRYRFGFLYNHSYLQLRGKHLDEYAVSLGFGLPIRSLKTVINLSGQVGTRGTTQSNLIKETYFKFVLGFSIYERWFIKRKYF